MPKETLRDSLIAHIRAHGPMRLDHYMETALYDPTRGYYTTTNPIGARGDFTTGPEISQLFGEMIGLWLVDMWRQAGAPEDALIVELGPGRGTMMQDIIRTVSAVSDMPLNPWLVETSPVLAAEQRARLSANWVEHLGDVPSAPVFLVATEFFDALPVRQFIQQGRIWQEQGVILNAAGDGLAMGPIDASEPPSRPLPPVDTPDRVIEQCPAALTIVEQIAHRLATHGGAALIIDYGYLEAHRGPRSKGSLQAIYNQHYDDPLAHPGEADITTHVDFAALAETARRAGAGVHGPLDQGAFLLRLGLAVRAEKLREASNPEQARLVDIAVHRLTSPDQMGSLFKVMALTGGRKLAPAGF